MKNELNNSVSTQENSFISNSNENYDSYNSKITNGIINILKKLLKKNKNLKNYSKILKEQENRIFNSKKIPDISLINYLERIRKYSEIENNTLIISLIYIDRLLQNSNLILTPFNIHRILFTSILISLKYNEDLIFEFSYYSQIAGISINELKIYESEFLKIIDFILYIDKNEFDKYKHLLLNSIENLYN